MTYGDPSPWAVGLVALLYGVSRAREWVTLGIETWRESRERPPLERLKHQYEVTDMGEAEFESRLEDLMDPCDEEMRRRLEDVDDVGHVIATEVAVHFDSLEHVRQADRAELEEVPDVGPTRAEAIVDALR